MLHSSVNGRACVLPLLVLPRHVPAGLVPSPSWSWAGNSLLLKFWSTHGFWIPSHVHWSFSRIGFIEFLEYTSSALRTADRDTRGSSREQVVVEQSMKDKREHWMCSTMWQCYLLLTHTSCAELKDADLFQATPLGWMWWCSWPVIVETT